MRWVFFLGGGCKNKNTIFHSAKKRLFNSFLHCNTQDHINDLINQFYFCLRNKEYKNGIIWQPRPCDNFILFLWIWMFVNAYSYNVFFINSVHVQYMIMHINVCTIYYREPRWFYRNKEQSLQYLVS